MMFYQGQGGKESRAILEAVPGLGYYIYIGLPEVIMNKELSVFIIYNLFPKPWIGLTAGAYCLFTAPAAPVQTAVAMGLLAGYAAKWSFSAARYLTMPIASRYSGLTVSEIRAMYMDPMQLRQISRDSKAINRKSLSRDGIKKSLFDPRSLEKFSKQSPPTVKANGLISFWSMMTAFAVAAGTCWVLKEPVSNYFGRTNDKPSSSDITPAPAYPAGSIVIRPTSPGNGVPLTFG